MQDVTDNRKVWRWEFSVCRVDMVTSSPFAILVHFHLQSATFSLRIFIHTLPTTKTVDNVNMTADTAMIAGPRAAWLLKLGTMPGGGTAAGIWQGSAPGGNCWELISVSLTSFLICRLFPFPAEGHSIFYSGSRDWLHAARCTSNYAPQSFSNGLKECLHGSHRSTWDSD